MFNSVRIAVICIMASLCENILDKYFINSVIYVKFMKNMLKNLDLSEMVFKFEGKNLNHEETIIFAYAISGCNYDVDSLQP